MTTELPSGYTFGKVVGQAIRAVGDQPEDTDYFPEAQPIVGKKCVVFTPKMPQVVTPDNGVATMVMQDKIECDMNSDGQLIRNDADPGEIGVWLYTGVWTVAFTGVMSGIKSFDILVTEFHAEDPLDLFANMATPISPSDPVTTLVVPSGGATGDILTWDPAIGGLKWIARTAFPDAEYVAQAQQAAQTSVDAKNVSVSSKNIAVLAKDDAVQAKNDAQTFAANFNTWFLRGNGSPVGVITPTSAGVQYVDLAVTTGASIWVSTGTTNSSWRVVEGNTGLRNIVSLLVNGWTATSVIISRFASSAIELRVIGLSGSAATSQTVLTIPSGFTSGNSFSLLLRDGLTLRALSVAYNGVVAAPLETASADASGVFKNPSPWPTTLPGTPA